MYVGGGTNSDGDELGVLVDVDAVFVTIVLLPTFLRPKVVKPAEFERVIIDTTVQEKAIAHPVDSRLLEIARSKIVQVAKRSGITLKQNYAKEGKELRRKAGGYAHAKQFRRMHKTVKCQRTILGIVLREIKGNWRHGRAGIFRIATTSEHVAGASTADSPAATERQKQTLRTACPGSRMHRQGQGAQTVRIRR